MPGSPCLFTLQFTISNSLEKPGLPNRLTLFSRVVIIATVFRFAPPVITDDFDLSRVLKNTLRGNPWMDCQIARLTKPRNL